MVASRKSSIRAAIVLVGLWVLIGCSREHVGGSMVVAELRDATGQWLGTAEFHAVEGGVELELEVQGLPPGSHGFHVHERRECEPPSFESAGGHFNPTHARHGLQRGDGHHLGDLPNLDVGPGGKARAKVLITGATLDVQGERSLLAGRGTALIIHARRDDQLSDPAGAAGSRIACGEIQRRTPTLVAAMR